MGHARVGAPIRIPRLTRIVQIRTSLQMESLGMRPVSVVISAANVCQHTSHGIGIEKNIWVGSKSDIIPTARTASQNSLWISARIITTQSSHLHQNWKLEIGKLLIFRMQLDMLSISQYCKLEVNGNARLGSMMCGSSWPPVRHANCQRAYRMQRVVLMVQPYLQAALVPLLVLTGSRHQ